MDRSALLVTLVLATIPLAGCIGDFEPGTDYKPTGKTVHLKMWVADMVQTEVFPGLITNMWAFCAAPADPNDAYSAAAIEYREPAGRVQVFDQATETYFFDDEQTQQCSVPGPQLRVQQGDHVIVDFVNDHFHAHTIHWHGQFVPWNSDGVPGSTQDSVQPGTSFRYEFEAKRAGTLWYHCHVDTQFHVMQGLYGVIIVEPQDEKLEPEVDNEYTLVFSNLIRELVENDPSVTDPHADHRHGGCGASGIPGCQNPAITQDADVFMINGVSAPNTFFRDDTLMKIEPDEKLRIRLLNAGPFTTETIHLHGHDMYVTHIDGNPIPEAARYWVDTILIGPGQRYDVVVEGREGNEGIWVMHTHITSRVTNSHQYPGGMLTKLVYGEWLEEQGGAVTPYDGVELPGGIPYIAPYVIPDDQFTTKNLDTAENLNTEPAVLLTEEIRVEQPCAVQQVWVDAKFTSNTGPLTQFNDITATLKDWSGNEVDTASPDEEGRVRFTIEDYYFVDRDGNEYDQPDAFYRVRDLPMIPGNLTFEVTGTGPSMDVDFMAMVDYYPTKEHMQYYSTWVGARDTCEEVQQPGYQQYPPQERPPL